MRRRAYTESQMRVLRDYFENSERQWLIDNDEEDIFNSWTAALDMVYATPGDWEWGYAVQCRGLCADSQYLMDWHNGVDVNNNEPPEPLPEYFTGTWSDPDIAEAYNAHMPKLLKLYGILDDIYNALDEEFTVGYYEMTELERERYDELNDEAYSAMYDFCAEHQDAVDELCNAAQKLLVQTNDYWYLDGTAADEYINEMADEWIANGAVWFDEDDEY